MEEDKVLKDGKQYYWCPKHQNDAGLYVTHHPLDHGKRPKDRKHICKNKSASEGSTSSNNINLWLSDSTKTALVSNGPNNEAA